VGVRTAACDAFSCASAGDDAADADDVNIAVGDGRQREACARSTGKECVQVGRGPVFRRQSVFGLVAAEVHHATICRALSAREHSLTCFISEAGMQWMQRMQCE
jgi:hypothetical protein